MTAASDIRVRRWLLVSAGAVLVAVVIGGITRLTESGLSITEWRPVSGILPPSSDQEWNDAYQRYLAIPEAQTIHRGITLSGFQALFWWEWIHRLLARFVGLILAVPYFGFLVRGQLRPGHRLRLLVLPLLAAAQGALGWYMVKSGLEVRQDVSPYRLTAHLGLALVIFAVCVWTALDLGPSRSAAGGPVRLRRWLVTALGLTIVTLLSGGFVAGLDAGLVYNTFPLMGGQVVPPGYFLSGAGWLNPFENPAAAQFHHRVLALGTAALLVLIGGLGRRPGVPDRLRAATGAAGLAALCQVGLGIATLLLKVPIPLAVLHQAMGLVVLAAVLVAAHTAEPRPSPSLPVTGTAP